MIRLSARRILVGATLALALAGCAKKVTNVDPAYTRVEGVTNVNSRLVVWSDTPIDVTTWADLAPPGPTPDDTLLSTESRYAAGAGSIHVQLLDGTSASGYQMFRREANGGFRQFRDFVLTSPRRWLDSQWELFQVVDAAPSGYTPATYVGRGVVSGTATPASPLSNAAELTQPVEATMDFSMNQIQNDSLFTISWGEDPDAVGYWLHVYQLRSDIPRDELIATGNPTAIVNARVRDIFVGYFPAGTTSYRIGSPAPLVLTRRGTLLGQTYLCRVSAVGVDGQIINYALGDLGLLQDEGTYRLFPLGAGIVETRRRTGPAPAGIAADGEDPGTGIPGLRLVSSRPGALSKR